MLELNLPQSLVFVFHAGAIPSVRHSQWGMTCAHCKQPILTGPTLGWGAAPAEQHQLINTQTNLHRSSSRLIWKTEEFISLNWENKVLTTEASRRPTLHMLAALLLHNVCDPAQPVLWPELNPAFSCPSLRITHSTSLSTKALLFHHITFGFQSSICNPEQKNTVSTFRPWVPRDTRIFASFKVPQDSPWLGEHLLTALLRCVTLWTAQDLPVLSRPSPLPKKHAGLAMKTPGLFPVLRADKNLLCPPSFMCSLIIKALENLTLPAQGQARHFLMMKWPSTWFCLLSCSCCTSQNDVAAFWRSTKVRQRAWINLR